MQQVKCLECFHTFSQTEQPPGKHDTPAGAVDGKTMYNTKCPECGTTDMMNEDYVGIPDEILQAYKENDVMLQHLLDYQDGELSETELREKVGLD